MGKEMQFTDKLNKGQDDEMVINGYLPSVAKSMLMYLLIPLTGGIILMLLSWKPSVRIKMSAHQCKLKDAKKILLQDAYEQEFLEDVIKKPGTTENPQGEQYFFNKKIKYMWNYSLQQYVKVEGLEVTATDKLHNMADGLTTEEAAIRLEYYEKNSIFIDIKPIHILIFLEVKSPFYLYQLFIIIAWMAQVYYQFSLAVLFLSIISIAATVWETRKQSKSLRDAVQSQSYVTVLRDGSERNKSSHDLVPGDVIIIKEANMVLECDAVLLSGTCVVNESMLTGESIPITKVPIINDPNVEYVQVMDKRSTLFCGTKILQSNLTDSPTVKAVVCRTAFNTVKGELVRSILFPMPVSFKMYKELFICMVIFLIMGIPAIIYTGIVFHSLGTFTKDVIIICIDVATFVVPPLLPAVFTSINAHAQRRLRKHNIFCLNSRYINFCGALDVVCFDKTGTLTEDSLDLSGVVPVKDGRFQGAMKDVRNLSDHPLVIAMATCHSLTKLGDELLGYTLDVKMFQAVGWEMIEPDANMEINFERLPLKIVKPPSTGNDKQEHAIIRVFPFESLLQRMTVVTKPASIDHFEVYIKGAPEVISSFSNRKTVPDNFKEVLELYTRQGFRVLGIGFRVMPSNLTWSDVLKMNRETFEEDIHFQGLLVLQNHLKLETIPALKILKDANIRTVMVTGDNLLTGSSIAAECGMVEESDSIVRVEADYCDQSVNQLSIYYSYLKYPGYSERLNVGQNGAVDDVHIPLISESRFHFAMDGTTFELLRKNDLKLLTKITQRGTVFARMRPEQKRDLVLILQNIGHMVGMCGDGANDCGALKTAHAGISLSMEEASVASPFTSKEQNIMCVPTVIREGRAALTSTFGSFRYMVCYCFVLLGAVLFLFWDGQKVSDGCFVVIDLVLNLLPPILFGNTEAYPWLDRRPPSRSILSFVQLFSMVSFFGIQLVVIYGASVYCTSQPWYEPFLYDHHRTHNSMPSHLGTTILSINMMAYVIAAVIFAPGPPYRKNLSNNKPYLVTIIILFLLVTYMTVYPSAGFRVYLNFRSAPYMEYHVVLYAISLANFIFCYVWEALAIQYLLFEKVMPFIKKARGPVEEYEKIDADIDANKGTWPPIGRTEEEIKSSSSKSIFNTPSHRLDESNTSLSKRNKAVLSRTSIDTLKSTVNPSWHTVREQSFESTRPPTTFVTFKDDSQISLVKDTKEQINRQHDSDV